MGAGLPNRDGHLAELHGHPIGPPEAGADAIAVAMVAGFQAPAQAVGNPSGHQQALHGLMPLHIDVELHHMGQGITPAGVVKHHGQVFPPAGEAIPVQIADGLAGCGALAQHIEGAGRCANGGVDDQPPRRLADAFEHIWGFIEGAVPPHPAGQFRRNQRIHHAQPPLQGFHAAAHHHHITANRRGRAVFRQGAVGGHKGFQMLMAIEAGSQGDQPPGLVQADGRIHVLTAQILAGLMPGELAQLPGQFGCQW